MAAKIQMTPGALTPSASGLWSIQFDAAGVAHRVDDAGNTFPMGGVTVHNLLSGRSTADSHPTSAITGLDTSLGSKEPTLGNPSVDGQHLASTAAGVRFWETPPSPARCFAGINDTQQSFGSPGVSELEIEWDTEILKHSDFTHSESTDPEEIEVEFSGWLEASYSINFESDESNRILTKAWLSKNGTEITESISYGYIRSYSYVDVTTNSLPPLPIQVTANDIIRVHAQYAYNDDVDSMPDSNDDVYTRVGESHIFLKELQNPEG